MEVVEGCRAAGWPATPDGVDGGGAGRCGWGMVTEGRGGGGGVTWKGRRGCGGGRGAVGDGCMAAGRLATADEVGGGGAGVDGEETSDSGEKRQRTGRDGR